MAADPKSTPPAEDRLDSWKEIASYLRKGVRTVQRWERSDGLPVRRLGQERQGSVFAYKSELDTWWQTQSRRLEAEVPAALDSTVQPGSSRRWWPFALAFLFSVSAFALWRAWPTPPAVYHAAPLTSDHGWEIAPSFSPDGGQIVYSWTPPGGVPHLYLKNVGSDSKQRLTTRPEPEAGAAWSPDGRFIAFTRRLEASRFAVVRIAASGGPEMQIMEKSGWSPLSWSGDGQWLIAVNGPPKMQSIVAVSIADGATHALTKPFEFGYTGFGLSPDNRRLIFSYGGPGATPISELELGPGLIPIGEPRAITEKLFITEMQVAADGKQVVYVDGSWEEGSLRRLRLVPGASPEPVYGSPDWFSTPALSRDGRRLVFAARHSDREEIWQKSLADASAAPSVVVSSTHSDLNPQYSPDGRHIAFHSTRTGASDIWIADQDGGNARRLTYTNARVTATSRWSPDGEWIAFESNQSGQSDVYVVPSRGGSPRRLTDHPAIDAIPRWSRDGKYLYFCSDRTGRFEIWKIAATGGDPVQVTSNGGFVAVESPDGRWLYYSQTRNFGPVLRMPLNGGPSEEVIADIRGLFFSVTARGIYYQSQGAIWFWDAATRETEEIFVPARSMGVGMDVSPDGKTLLFTQKTKESTGADLYLIDGLR